MEKKKLFELSAFLTCLVSSPQECFDEEREAGGGGGGGVGGRRWSDVKDCSGLATQNSAAATGNPGSLPSPWAASFADPLMIVKAMKWMIFASFDVVGR